MKKKLCILLLLCLVLGLAACGPSDKPENPDNPNQPDKPDNPPAVNYTLTEEMIQNDMNKIEPLIASHDMQILEVKIKDQAYNDVNKELGGNVFISAETPTYTWSGTYKVTYTTESGTPVFKKAESDADWKLNEGANPGESFISLYIKNNFDMSLDEIGDENTYDKYYVGEFTASNVDGNTKTTYKGSITFDYDFQKEDWVRTDFQIVDTVKEATYDDKSGTYTLVLTNKYEECDQGLVVTARTLSKFTYKDSYVKNTLKVGTVLKLSKQKGVFIDLKDLKVTCLEHDVTQSGKNVIFLTDRNNWEWYYIEQQSNGSWLLCYEFEGDGPGSGYVTYLGSSIRILFNDKSKIIKEAIFDQTEEKTIKDIRTLYSDKKKITALYSSVKLNHGVVTKCNVAWPL